MLRLGWCAVLFLVLATGRAEAVDPAIALTASVATSSSSTNGAQAAPTLLHAAFRARRS
jgi:hypothetical protein